MDPVIDSFKALLDIHANAWMFGCLCTGVLALVVAFFVHARLVRRHAGPDAMQDLDRAMHLGARGYLRTHLAAAALVTLVGSVGLLFAFQRAGDAWTMALGFFCGCVGSTIAGFVGLRMTSAGGVRAAQAASAKGLGSALRTAYAPAFAAALVCVGLAVVAATGLYLGTGEPRRIFAFALGASVAALLARVAGGVYAKAADMGLSIAVRADKDIPDDSAANPGVIADQVGDCIGGATAMGADLFESFAGAVVAAMALGAAAWSAIDKGGRTESRDAVAALAAGPATLVVFPVTVVAAGVVAAILAGIFVKTENERRVTAVLQRSTIVAGALVAIGSAVLMFVLGLEDPRVTVALTGAGAGDDGWRYSGPFGVFLAVLVGLALAAGLSWLAEWQTSDARRPARKLAEESEAGPAVNVIAGMSLGMASCAWPAVLIAVAAGLAYYMAGVYGIGLAAVGLLANVAAPLAVHAFGAVAENARAAAEIGHLSPDARRRTEALDATASATAAVGKAYATGAAALTVFALLAAFHQAFERVHADTPLRLDLSEIQVELGLVLGAAAPFLFSSYCLRGSLRVARTLADQVVSHFAQEKVRTGSSPVDHDRFVAGGARRAIRRTGPPALLALGLPVVCALSPLGARGLVGMLVGATVTGTMLAFSLTHSGAAWDSAKRYVESGVFGGKGSPAYRAAAVGDVVGDPMKGAAGPGIHTLLKLMTLLALVLLPLFPF